MKFETLPRWYLFIPFVLSLLLVAGNYIPTIPIWGFDYHVLNIPFGSDWEWFSNLVILAIGLFPLFANWPGWHHFVYQILATFALLILAINLSTSVYFWSVPLSGAAFQTVSVFNNENVQRITCVIAIIYLAWSLTLATLTRREIRLLVTSVAISGILTGWHVRDISLAYQIASIDSLTEKTRSSESSELPQNDISPK